MGDIVEGVPVVYSTFVGYDEVAHHSGIEQPDAFAVLRQHDAQLARLERAIELAPRPYHLVVLSDHGQSQGRPVPPALRASSSSELVAGVRSRDGEVFAPAAADEGLSTVGGALTDARDEDNGRGPDARPRDPRPPRRRRGRARPEPRGGRAGRRDASEHEPPSCSPRAGSG